MSETDDTQPIAPPVPPETKPSDDKANGVAIAQHAADLLLAYDNIPDAAEQLKEWVKQTLGDAVAMAYWITISKHRDSDKGTAIEVFKVGHSLRAELLLGAHSGGIGLFTPDYDVAALHLKLAIGVGAVLPYDGSGGLQPIVGITVHF